MTPHDHFSEDEDDLVDAPTVLCTGQEKIRLLAEADLAETPTLNPRRGRTGPTGVPIEREYAPEPPQPAPQSAAARVRASMDAHPLLWGTALGSTVALLGLLLL